MLYNRSLGNSNLALNDYISRRNFPMCYQNPMILEERKMFTSPIDIFSRLMSERIIFLGDVIDSEVANIIQAQLVYLESRSDEDIVLYINSPGGSVVDGLGIYDTIQLVKPDVKTVCTAMAASMASILLAGGTKGKRSILRNGRVLIHQPSGMTYGTAADMLIDCKEIEKDRQNLFEILSEHTGQSVKKLMQDANRDFWLNAQESLDYGIVDKVIRKCE